jgi:hypothetical protein
MSDQDNLIIYPIPSLASTLLKRERAKGSPLTEEEVIAIRDDAPCVVLPPDEAAKVDERRGYLDLDPENCWAEWQRIRLTFEDPGGDEGGHVKVTSITGL